MSPSDSGFPTKAIGWALLSQVVWLPLVGIDLHDRWQAHQREITPPGKPLPPSPLARATPFSINDLLGATRPVQQLASQANQAVSGALGQALNGAVSGAGLLLSSASNGASSLLDRPLAVSFDSPSEPPAGRPAAATPLAMASPAPTLLGRAFTRAQLLGGSLGLGDLNEGPMTALALVERAIQTGSGDPLAPLPSLWREPMRQALLMLPGTPQRLTPARVVHVPSARVRQSTEVPLALQSDGSVDILQAPSDPAVVGEIDAWSRQQRPPSAGSLAPAVVHLHPMPEAPSPSPRQVESPPPAAATPQAAAPASSTPSAASLPPVSISLPPAPAPAPEPAAAPAPEPVAPPAAEAASLPTPPPPLP